MPSPALACEPPQNGVTVDLAVSTQSNPDGRALAKTKQ
jgi:hypothetical protein